MAMRLRAIGVGVLSLVVVGVVAVALAGGSVQGTRAGAAGNGLIAFTRADGIYVMRADGSGVRALKRGVAADASGLAWSPDGRKLAFVVGDAIWVTNADGSDSVRLVAGDPDGPFIFPASPTWSPDGGRIAFTAGPHNDRDIWVMSADGSDKRRMVRTPRLSEYAIDWSSAGGQVAFDIGFGWDPPKAYVMNTDGSDVRPLTLKGVLWSAEADWSPDGRRIVLTQQGKQWGREIYVMDAGGRSQVRLTRNKVREEHPVWSPDGHRIAFLRWAAKRAHRCGVNCPPFPRDIYVMNADGTGVTRLTHSPATERSLAWQPIRQAP